MQCIGMIAPPFKETNFSVVAQTVVSTLKIPSKLLNKIFDLVL